MRKIIYVITLTFLFCININVKAEYSCTYYSTADKDNGSEFGTLTVQDDKTLIFKGRYDDNTYYLSETFAEYFFQRDEVKNVDNGCGDAIYACLIGGRCHGKDSDRCGFEYDIFNDESEEKEGNGHSKTHRGGCVYYYIDGYNDDNPDDPDKPIPDSCVVYDVQMQAIENHYGDYSNCTDENCKVESLNSSNNLSDRVSSMCNSILKEANYDDPCVSKCLELNDKMYSLKVKYGIDYTTNSTNCSLSDRVIKWIANIVKWVKYIAPILVIIFGIMDFIKAIAAQSEDEMKKAQSRFIKRLIVAALVFIVPFLIEYVLTSFKLVSDFCDII